MVLAVSGKLAVHFNEAKIVPDLFRDIYVIFMVGFVR